MFRHINIQECVQEILLLKISLVQTWKIWGRIYLAFTYAYLVLSLGGFACCFLCTSSSCICTNSSCCCSCANIPVFGCSCYEPAPVDMYQLSCFCTSFSADFSLLGLVSYLFAATWKTVSLLQQSWSDARCLCYKLFCWCSISIQSSKNIINFCFWGS